jgi:hypothetical protein
VFQILITDVTGKIVEQHDLLKNEGALPVAARLKSGIYFISLASEGKLFETLKVVKL